jgi:hypothetical protein
VLTSVPVVLYTSEYSESAELISFAH